MSIVLNISESELEKGILGELEPVLKILIERVIHRELGKASKREVNNGVWKPLPPPPPGSLSAEMWSVFESENINRISPDFKRLNLIGLAHEWDYKTLFGEYERWRRHNM